MLEIVISLAVFSPIIFILNLYCVVVIFMNRKMFLNRPRHNAIFCLLISHLLQGLFVVPSYAMKRSGIDKFTPVCDIFR